MRLQMIFAMLLLHAVWAPPLASAGAETELELRVARGLAYLSRQQASDGSFESDGPKVAMTGLGLMAFLSAGHTPEVGRHGMAVRQAVDFLLDQAPEDGYFGGVDGSRMYGQAIVTLALSEVYGVEPDPYRRRQIHQALTRAVEVIRVAQAVEKEEPHAGGWRYERQSADSDLSLAGWNVLALRSAQNIGLLTPREPVERAVQYVLRCYRPEQGGFAYQPGRSATPAMTGVALLALSLLDEADRPEAQSAAEFLRENQVGEQSRFAYYAMYYVTQAAFQAGEPTWNTVWPGLRDRLIEMQAEDGSWPQSSSKGEPGQVYTTSMAVLTLAVPYRVLPIYQR
jgi:hypothetical protein